MDCSNSSVPLCRTLFTRPIVALWDQKSAARSEPRQYQWITATAVFCSSTNSLSFCTPELHPRNQTPVSSPVQAPRRACRGSRRPQQRTALPSPSLLRLKSLQNSLARKGFFFFADMAALNEALSFFCYQDTHKRSCNSMSVLFRASRITILRFCAFGFIWMTWFLVGRFMDKEKRVTQGNLGITEIILYPSAGQ